MYDLISLLIIPIIVLIIIGYGLYNKKDIYSSFIKGAREGFNSSIKLFPYLLSIIFATNILFNSNFINDVLTFVKPVFSLLKIPFEIVPLAIMKSISGSASLAITTNLLHEYGSNSIIGKMASIIQSSSETTFYVITLFYGYIGIKKIRHTLLVSLIADIVGVLVSIMIARLIFFN